MIYVETRSIFGGSSFEDELDLEKVRLAQRIDRLTDDDLRQPDDDLIESMGLRAFSVVPTVYFDRVISVQIEDIGEGYVQASYSAAWQGDENMWFVDPMSHGGPGIEAGIDRDWIHFLCEGDKNDIDEMSCQVLDDVRIVKELLAVMKQRQTAFRRELIDLARVMLSRRRRGVTNAPDLSQLAA